MTGTILLVTRETHLLNQLRRLLSKNGHEVLAARDASEAESVAGQARPDLAILDAALPDGGVSLARSLRESTPAMPVVLLVSAATEEKGVAVDGYVRKPVQAGELLTTAGALVRVRALQTSLEHAEATLVAIAAAVEARSAYPPTHLWRVAGLSTRLAEARGLDQEAQRIIRTAALLRDIGNIAVPDAILTKPGPLTAEEFARVKEHPVLGAELSRHLAAGEAVSAIVRGHHERWDGKGYPDGLKKDAIPLGARIVAIADAYAAHTTDRPYRAALSVEEAREILWGGGELQWDPNLVESFMALPAEDDAAGGPAV